MVFLIVFFICMVIIGSSFSLLILLLADKDFRKQLVLQFIDLFSSGIRMKKNDVYLILLLFLETSAFIIVGFFLQRYEKISNVFVSISSIFIALILFVFLMTFLTWVFEGIWKLITEKLLEPRYANQNKDILFWMSTEKFGNEEYFFERINLRNEVFNQSTLSPIEKKAYLKEIVKKQISDLKELQEWKKFLELKKIGSEARSSILSGSKLIITFVGSTLIMQQVSHLLKSIVEIKYSKVAIFFIVLFLAASISIIIATFFRNKRRRNYLLIIIDEIIEEWE